MVYTKLQRSYLQSLKSYHACPPTFLFICRRAWKYFLMVVIVLGLLLWVNSSIPGFPGLQIVIGIVIGAALKTLALFGLSVGVYGLPSKRLLTGKNWTKLSWRNKHGRFVVIKNNYGC